MHSPQIKEQVRKAALLLMDDKTGDCVVTLSDWQAVVSLMDECYMNGRKDVHAEQAFLDHEREMAKYGTH